MSKFDLVAGLKMLRTKLGRLKCCHLRYRHSRWIMTGIASLVVLLLLISHDRASVNQFKNLELVEEDPRFYVNCTKVISGDEEAIKLAKLQTISKAFKNRPVLSEEDYINLTKHCDNFIKLQKYITFPLSKEEEEFPIAYSIVIHHRIDMFERLLRSIYTPQNLYCIHVDQKSPKIFQDAVQSIVSCFDNVFLTSQFETVIYASWSRVQADLNCMKDLLGKNSRWKYLINLCGKDFPIKTNLEMVELLKVLKGTNSLETEKTAPHKEMRWKIQHIIENGKLKNTGTKKEAPPIDTPMFSGSAYFVLTRDFVEYLWKSSKIQKFIEWERDTYSPDEHMWATLQRMPDVPGSVPVSEKFDVSDMNAIARLVKWSYLEGDISKGAPYPPCTGTHVRAVCVYGAGDLKWMLQQHHLFANKFDTEVDGVAIQCLEEHLRHKAISNLLNYA
ncbi:beta-1,3-galactosyl-O-glycosyl-glycoprotein beta-1,6-N-acetylglucosaminyltransferase [Pristis pectinata]|uniref:beta-1,3-galactosyl-O-glycosyl-glycoprotein beta-1,6-N-acetylglucosaminyltransferase n=1 Tax=Pristis pectinata TaxID=685728 RepID=UPI00223D11A9|nr:beta-1,3-galactosyl-O-glycosyl-glycoprotein beta-1,6-N-acetylglucosaminyltransferase [Pristis pectinata]XP_051875365.1 beta-1,3-galactosyl-O-glycosyl-glycoprotein beta-1,6-N-acetylglucosaminyltransferase [Pristis pectinata]XP_051875366.1 beta-1,3-galactosyl-O-glycosyl-glycoprotein beta-1,6-N-acetylglucosaminyltransferase [Pristis pectinata]XP_051875367.1 beta-1,3-galactosyl-O-glycosyl-glycoprotein beta-1,6-N-acetylglucosaminyltransferase [Pristis pectinata]XP_051875368.1 beta-1,3-galactosyl-